MRQDRIGFGKLGVQHPTMQDYIPYDLKYAPLVQSLTGCDQSWLSHYPLRIARHFEDLEKHVLSNYMGELEQDFNELYALAFPSALSDIALANRLVAAKADLARFKRLLKRRHRFSAQDALPNLCSLLRNMHDLQILILRPSM